MNVLGLITEYNPFHNGHLYHIKQSKIKTCSEHIVCVMSGNYVQRGEPAIVDKYVRTAIALRNGADLVIELPVFYASSSAENFAFGSVKILDSLGIVNSICFGSENCNMDVFKRAAEVLISENGNYKTYLKQQLDAGVSFPVAREYALEKTMNMDVSLCGSPNNILGIEYLKAILRLNSKIQPYTIMRHSSDYHSMSLNGEFCSATAIRNAVSNGDIEKLASVMPSSCYNIIAKEASVHSFAYLDNLSAELKYVLALKQKKELSEILDVTEGLENRILKFAAERNLISDIVFGVKTKRYTFTKLQRAILHIILDIRAEELLNYNSHGGPQYVRVLGLKKEKSFLLREIQKKSKLPVITNVKKDISRLEALPRAMLEKEIQVSDIYYLAQEKSLKQISKNYDMKNMLVV